MFLTKEDFQDSIDIMETYEHINTESDIKPAMIEKYAREVFEDFEMMLDDDKEQVKKMIFDDIYINLYNIN